MKKCTRCRKTYDSMDFFPKDSSKKSGYGSRCKRCKAYVESPALAKLREQRRRERDKVKIAARMKAKYHYRNSTFNCAAIGCDKPANHLHHVDYNEPLAIVPLCEHHHVGIHQA